MEATQGFLRWHHTGHVLFHILPLVSLHQLNGYLPIDDVHVEAELVVVGDCLIDVIQGIQNILHILLCLNLLRIELGELKMDQHEQTRTGRRRQKSDINPRSDSQINKFHLKFRKRNISCCPDCVPKSIPEVFVIE
uniref:Secreted protein n=1 Tax=Lutzomyia longipalpis TaxID=7200 RepID=A0A1B0CHB9_LUTLO